MIWFTSDQHYNHKKIITDFIFRPFDDVEHMNRALIVKHNNVVGKNDLVYHLGDFGFGSREQLSFILSQLNGEHVLIKGNHDKGYIAMLDVGFRAVLKSAVVVLMGHPVLLNHRPLEVLPEGIYKVLHGHIHNLGPGDRCKAGKLEDIKLFNRNVSVEVTNYQPVSYKKALKRV